MINDAPIPVTINAVAPTVTTPALAYALSSDAAAVQRASLLSNLHQQLHAVSVPLASTAAEVVSGLPPGLPPYPSPPTSSTTSAYRPIRSQRTPMRDIVTLDDPQELDEFLSQGEDQCIADMKQFVNQYSLRQTTVAHMTGVSQPYISKLLNGNHKELSLRCRRNIYSWYLNCRRHPEKISSYVADPSTRLETNGDGELIPQRRERYVFRPILIRTLERYFADNQFPDLEKRIEIASVCNQALQAEKKGMGLMPKEIVSPQVVANWFANKRKELRRRSDVSNEGTTHGAHQQSSSDAASTPSPSSIVLDTMYNCGSGRPASLQRLDSHSPMLVSDAASKESTDSLAIIQSQLEAVNNSVLTLVNPYRQLMASGAVKTEEDSD
uniref:Homeobox domain-containing protein n=1 Tax=Plectus sambesii TaxID=2011161 RepID=A0A914UR77_9BILA